MPSLIAIPKSSRQALWLWAAFFCLALVLNGTPLLLEGIDLRTWTYSKAKDVLFGVTIYGGLFMAGPILIVTDRSLVRRADFWMPLMLGVAALGFRPWFRSAALITLTALAYLHVRHDLSRLGVRSLKRGRDIAAVLLLGLMPLAIRVLTPEPWGWHPGPALRAGLDRLLLNPASTTENLFYFGFLAERLGPWAGRWGTPVLIGALYTAHEMSNPEYWYEEMNFSVVFLGVALTTAVYLWSRNSVAIWLSSGLARFITRLW